MTKELFKGLKVLDVGTWIAAPVAATILGDFGADVIKIEIPGQGDQYRTLSGLPITPDAPDNYMWQMDARNKRSLTLNLKTEEGIEILHRLVAECDVYITNQPFPMRDALKLNYEDLKPLNPGMIYASLTAYGEKGEDRNREGFDLVAYWARTGLMDLIHDPQAIPSQGLPGMGDHPAAVSLYAAIVTALLKKERLKKEESDTDTNSAEGTMVHTSLMANGLWSVACIAQAGFSSGSYDKYRAFRRHRRFPTAVYETFDGRYLQFTMVRSPEELMQLVECLGLIDTFKDERFATPEGRFEHGGEISGMFQDRIRGKTASDWMAIFKAQQIPAVLVARVEELPDDSQVYVNNMVVQPAASEATSPYLINHPVNVEGVSRTRPGKAPEVGEHSEEILQSIGYDAGAVARLRAQGII